MPIWFSAQSLIQKHCWKAVILKSTWTYFISPNFLKKEILKHNARILKITEFEKEDLEAIKSAIYHRIEFILASLFYKNFGTMPTLL